MNAENEVEKNNTFTGLINIYIHWAGILSIEGVRGSLTMPKWMIFFEKFLFGKFNLFWYCLLPSAEM